MVEHVQPGNQSDKEIVPKGQPKPLWFHPEGKHKYNTSFTLLNTWVTLLTQNMLVKLMHVRSLRPRVQLCNIAPAVTLALAKSETAVTQEASHYPHSQCRVQHPELRGCMQSTAPYTKARRAQLIAKFRQHPSQQGRPAEHSSIQSQYIYRRPDL